MKSTLSLLIGLAALASYGVETSAAENSLKTVEVVTLYSEAGHKPDVYCDFGTLMTINYIKKTVSLREFVSGICEIAAAPNERIYRLKMPADGIGDLTMTGTRIVRGPDSRERRVHLITITDHRKSLLPVIHPAMFEVTETLPSSGTVKVNKLFSYDVPPVRADKMTSIYNCKNSLKQRGSGPALVVVSEGGIPFHHEARVTKIETDMRSVVRFSLLDRKEVKNRDGSLAEVTFSTIPNADESMSLTLDLTRLVKDPDGASAYFSALEFEGRKTGMFCAPMYRPF